MAVVRASESNGQLLEIACDESGSEGENLIGGETDVFAHASVLLSNESAGDCIREARDRIGSPAQEYKANHLLRQKHRAVLVWLLEPSGPIHGHAHVHLIDKTFFAIGKLVDLLPRGPDTETAARTLYREGRSTFGGEEWADFLRSFNDLMRVRNRRGPGISVESFFQRVDILRRTGAPGPAHDLIGLLWEARPRVTAFRAELIANPRMSPALDPLVPALAQTVKYWTTGGNPVAIVHDKQPALTKHRVAELEETLGGLAGLRLVDSRSDARVQVADFLAGVARKIASEELNGRGDPELTALLRPYVNPGSVWGDDRSAVLLGVRNQQHLGAYRTEAGG